MIYGANTDTVNNSLHIIKKIMIPNPDIIAKCSPHF